MKRYVDTVEEIHEFTDYNLEDFPQDYNNDHNTVYPETNGGYPAFIPSLPD